MSQYLLHLERARDYYDECNYEGAQAAAAYALDCAEPGQGDEARILQAMCYRRLEMNDEAIKLFAEIIQTSPSPEACAEYALMCAERGHCDAACRDYATRARDDDPDLASAYMALFWCDSMDGLYQDAVRNLRRGIHRGGEFSESRAFEMIRGWCQELCDNNNLPEALALSSEVVELFNNFDFIVLHARLSDLSGDHRQAVTFYKRALMYLRPGGMRTDILEAIARIAI